MTKATFSPTDDQVWPAQGQWTYEDYLRLPDDGRRYWTLSFSVGLAIDFPH